MLKVRQIVKKKVRQIVTRPVLDRFHDSSKVNALCFMLYALCLFGKVNALCFMVYAYLARLMLYALCFIWLSVLKAPACARPRSRKLRKYEKVCKKLRKCTKSE
jgi:hypothetical protein